MVDEPSVAPREVVRDVAASLKSLAKVLPYAEYAAIVHRIADLRWRYASSASASASFDVEADFR
jgi:hypothetical protein